MLTYSLPQLCAAGTCLYNKISNPNVHWKSSLNFLLSHRWCMLMVKRYAVGLAPASACEPVESGCEKIPLEHLTDKGLHCLKQKITCWTTGFLSSLLSKPWENILSLWLRKKDVSLDVKSWAVFSEPESTLDPLEKKILKVVKPNRLQLDIVF